MSFVSPKIIGQDDVPEAVRDAQQVAVEHSRYSGGYGRDVGVRTIANSEIRARWKIEVLFGAGRTIRGPNAVGIQIWESGKHFHGGGDALAYFCKNRDNTDEGCGRVIGEDSVTRGVAYCPHCQRTVNAELLQRMCGGKLSSQNLAREIARLWRELEGNADIYLKYHPSDIRYVTMARLHGQRVAHRLKGMHFYALKNILKDTNAGADLVGRFHAFITS